MFTYIQEMKIVQVEIPVNTIDAFRICWWIASKHILSREENMLLLLVMC